MAPLLSCLTGCKNNKKSTVLCENIVFLLKFPPKTDKNLNFADFVKSYLDNNSVLLLPVLRMYTIVCFDLLQIHTTLHYSFIQPEKKIFLHIGS